MAGEQGIYWVLNRGTAPPLIPWDVYKRYTRGQYKMIISRVRRDMGLALEEAERKVQPLEYDYVTNKGVPTYDAI